MAGETTITVVGNLTGDPELRFTPSGQAVSNFTIASTPRTFDKQKNAWVDGDTLFLRCSIWRDAAENVTESLEKGSRVIAVGRLVQRSYEKDKQTHTVVELQVDEIGPSLKWASAKVRRTGREQAGTADDARQAAKQATRSNTRDTQDPWATSPAGEPPW
jgi:single-strand DNA-binding protein